MDLKCWNGVTQQVLRYFTLAQFLGVILTAPGTSSQGQGALLNGTDQGQGALLNGTDQGQGALLNGTDQGTPPNVTEEPGLLDGINDDGLQNDQGVEARLRSLSGQSVKQNVSKGKPAILAESDHQFYFVQNRHKYLQSLRNFHDKLQRKDEDIKVNLPDDPWGLIGQPCTPELYKALTGEYVKKGEPLRQYHARLKATTSFAGTCVQPNSLPVLECNKVTRTCTCQNASYTPLNFVARNSTNHPDLSDPCFAVQGSVCDGDYMYEGRNKKINCFPGMTCVLNIGICGGIGGLMENAFAGEELTFTPLEMEEAVVRAGGVENVLLDLQMQDTHKVGSNCNFTNWNKIARSFVRVLENIDSTNLFNESLHTAFQDETGVNGTAIFNGLWVKTDPNTKRCLDFFPSMVCAKGRGGSLVADTCECGRISKWFNYTAVKGICVAYEGSVCTTMHGPLSCREVPDFNYRCGKFELDPEKLKRTEVPSVLTAFDLKVCSDPNENDSRGNVSQRRAMPAGVTGPRPYIQEVAVIVFLVIIMSFLGSQF